MERLNLVDKKFSRLLVIADAGNDKQGNSIWQCKCDCGNEKIIRGKNLINGFSQSCGCLNKEKVIEANSGANNHNWKGGVTPENEKIRKLIEYKNWRTQIFERDDYICQLCDKKSEADIQAHHIYLFADYPGMRFRIWNGITLCKNCHEEIRGKEHQFIEQFLDITLERLKNYINRGDV